MHGIKIITTDIYRKPTTTSTVIHKTSNHPQEHKDAAFRFLLNRMHNLPLTQQQKQKEWTNILHTAKENGYTQNTIERLNTRIRSRTKRTNPNTLQQKNGLPSPFTVQESVESLTYFGTQT
jgi:hypothetical protein